MMPKPTEAQKKRHRETLERFFVVILSCMRRIVFLKLIKEKLGT